jgi:hypothetical protein
MAAYAIFNYQFYPIYKQDQQGVFEGMEYVQMTAKEAFDKKQTLFGDLLLKDFEKEKPEDIIHFTYGKGPKEYIHRHLMPPTDDIVIMRVANHKIQTIVDANLKEKRVDDYQNSIVIIDNRPGIQRMLIENKKVAFRDVKQLANILDFTFNKLLSKYYLSITLDHLQDSRQFWQYANDRTNFPIGFYKVSFKLPYPNLERLRKVYDRLFSKVRESFDSRLDLEFTSPKGEVRLNEQDIYQNEAIKWFMEEAGGEVRLYSNQAKRSPIVVGKNSYLSISVSDSIIQRVIEDAINDDMFGSAALDEIKKTAKIGIDLNK